MSVKQDFVNTSCASAQVGCWHEGAALCSGCLSADGTWLHKQHRLKGEMSKDLSRGRVCRRYFAIQHEAVGVWHRRDIVLCKETVEAPLRSNLAPLSPISVAHAPDQLFFGAVQENREHVPTGVVHDCLELLECRAIGGVGVAFGHDHERHVVRCRCRQD